jgi:hypothetical protein
MNSPITTAEERAGSSVVCRAVPTFGRESRVTLALALPLIAGQVGQMLMGSSSLLKLFWNCVSEGFSLR